MILRRNLHWVFKVGSLLDTTSSGYGLRGISEKSWGGTL